MNDATHLLTQLVRETNAASVLAASLVEAAAATEVLHARECKPCVDTLERHLRHAHAAAVGLTNLANGLNNPKTGD